MRAYHSHEAKQIFLNMPMFLALFTAMKDVCVYCAVSIGVPPCAFVGHLLNLCSQAPHMTRALVKDLPKSFVRKLH